MIRFTPACLPVHGVLAVLADKITINERNMQVIDMHRWFLILAAVLLLGDQGSGILDMVQGSRDYLAAFTISLFAVPWVVAQFDN